MTTELQKDKSTRPTDRSYESFGDFIKGENVSVDVQQKIAEIESVTNVVTMLAAMRTRAGLTQEQMSEKLGNTQSAISKIENGRDEAIMLTTIQAYAAATGERIMAVFGPPLNHYEAVQMHAAGLKENLLALAKRANQQEELETEIQAFFGQAFFHILNILASCEKVLPRRAASFARFSPLGRASVTVSTSRLPAAESVQT